MSPELRIDEIQAGLAGLLAHPHVRRLQDMDDNAHQQRALVAAIKMVAAVGKNAAEIAHLRAQLDESRQEIAHWREQYERACRALDRTIGRALDRLQRKGDAA